MFAYMFLPVSRRDVIKSRWRRFLRSRAHTSGKGNTWHGRGCGGRWFLVGQAASPTVAMLLCAELRPVVLWKVKVTVQQIFIRSTASWTSWTWTANWLRCCTCENLCKRRMVLFPDVKVRKSPRQQLQRISEYPKISQASSSRASLGFPWTIRMAGDF